MVLKAAKLLFFGACLLSPHFAVSQDNGMLQSLPSLEELRRSTKRTRRTFNLDILSRDGEEIAVCHLIEMNRHSVLAGSQRLGFPNKFPLEALAAVALALEHLNTGNGRVVQEVEGLSDRCNVRFTSEFVDTAGMESQAVDRVIEILERDNQTENKYLPCGFIGAFRSPTSVATSILTGIKGYPQFSGLSTSSQLSDKATFPLFGRVIPTANLYSIPLLDYLYNKLGLRHLAVLHTDKATDLSYVDGIRQVASTQYPKLRVRAFAYRDDIGLDQWEWEAPIAAVRQTGFRYIFAIGGENKRPGMMDEAYRQGIAGNGDFNWFFSNPIGTVFYLGSTMPPDSPVHQSAKGALTFTTVGMLPGIGRVDAFEQAWKELANDHDIAYLQTKVPQYPGVPTYDPQFSKQVFDSMVPFTPLLYDVTIAMGLGACSQSTTPNSSAYLSGPDHYASTLKISFVGASGTVMFDPKTGDRNASSALYVLENLTPRAEMDENGVKTGNFTLVPVQVAYYNDGEWTQIEEIVFNDGTTQVPPDLPPPTIDFNFIPTGMRAGGLTMAGLVIAASLCLSIWTQVQRKCRIVRASQPIFLHLICAGTLLMGASIIPLSIDDNIATQDGCTVACMAFPWLLALGWCIAMSALFTKTHRINRIFHNPSFRRVTVSVADVVKPMAVFIATTILILSLWTGIDPLQWTREIISYDPYGRPDESRGYCTSPHSLAFLIPLVVTNMGVLIFTLYQAFVARKISTEFAESEYIARAMTVALVLGFLGIPIAILAEDNSTVFFFVISAIIFVGCMALLLFIFVPKITYHRKTKKHSQRKSVADSIRGYRRYSNAPLSTQSSESSDVGAKVVDHPKLKDQLEDTVETLKDENKSLKQRIHELEDIFEDCEDDDILRARYNESKRSVSFSTEVPVEEEGKDQASPEQNEQTSHEAEIGAEDCSKKESRIKD